MHEVETCVDASAIETQITEVHVAKSVAGVQNVVSGTAAKLVFMTVAPCDRVVSLIAPEAIIAGTAHDSVVAPARDQVVAPAAV
jgi:hypothetical protein